MQSDVCNLLFYGWTVSARGLSFATTGMCAWLHFEVSCMLRNIIVNFVYSNSECSTKEFIYPHCEQLVEHFWVSAVNASMFCLKTALQLAFQCLLCICTKHIKRQENHQGASFGYVLFNQHCTSKWKSCEFRTKMSWTNTRDLDGVWHSKWIPFLACKHHIPFCIENIAVTQKLG